MCLCFLLLDMVLKRPMECLPRCKARICSPVTWACLPPGSTPKATNPAASLGGPGLPPGHVPNKAFKLLVLGPRPSMSMTALSEQLALTSLVLLPGVNARHDTSKDRSHFSTSSRFMQLQSNAQLCVSAADSWVLADSALPPSAADQSHAALLKSKARLLAYDRHPCIRQATPTHA